MIPGFDKGMVGMQIGEVKSLQVSSEDAYGPRVDEAIQDVPKTAFPPDFEFVIDGTVQGTGPDGRPVLAKILKEQDESVTLDFNHPLAGQQLNFEVELVEISEE